MSFGGFGGFGSNNNNQQSTGFGGFGSNNNNNNNTTGGKYILVLCFFFRHFARLATCALLQRAPPVRQPVSNSPRRQALDPTTQTLVAAYSAPATTRVAPCSEAATRARPLVAVVRLVRRTLRVVLRRYLDSSKQRCRRTAYTLAQGLVTFADFGKSRKRCAQNTIIYCATRKLTSLSRRLRRKHWHHSLWLKTLWQLDDWRWSIWWWLYWKRLWWLRCQQ